MPTTVLNVPPRHPLNKLSESLKQKLVAAQTNLFEMEFSNAADLSARALSDLKIAIKTPPQLRDQLAASLVVQRGFPDR